MIDSCPPTSGAIEAGAGWEAFGSQVVLRITDTRLLALARRLVERELEAIDRTCSRFRADSELSRANDLAGQTVRVSPLLAEAIELALSAARATDGDVEPTVGGALERAGYDRDWRLLRAPAGQPEPPRISVRMPAGWRTVALDRAASTLKVAAGVRLDLGATAKAWAADRAAASVFASTGCGVLVSLGGDIATRGPSLPDGWKIRVTEDHRNEPSAPGQTVSIRSGGLATSSTAVRRWSHDGHTMHHLIDPATGAPARTPWRTVSVAAANCAQANIAATAALIRGHAALRWLAELRLPARLQAGDGRIVTVSGWPASEQGFEEVLVS